MEYRSEQRGASGHVSGHEAGTQLGNRRRALIGMSYKGPSLAITPGKPVALTIDRYW